MSRHSRWTTELASPRNLRLGSLLLLLIMVNQINDPLVDATVTEMLLYWVVRILVLAGGLWLADSLVSKWLAGRVTHPEWLKPVVLVSALGLVPFALAEALLEQSLPVRPEFLDDELWAYSPVLGFLGEYITVASVVVPIHFLLWLIIDRKVEKPGATSESEMRSSPEFLQRSTALDVRDVLALQAEEHYVRIHTGEGSELVHCRFGDAVEDMPDDLGLQVHRSWWVAESAVQSARRGSRRWQLNLLTGIDVPVSDSYVAAARERGWLMRKRKKS